MASSSFGSVPTTLVGAAGEHYVMFQLYRRGIMVGQPPQGVADVDLLVLDEKAQIMKNIQVKTRSKGADGGWHMKKKHDTLISPHLWYVFVDMEPDSPTCFVIPSQVVADAVRTAHQIWMATPGLKGQAHKETDMRRIRPSYPFDVTGYPNGWMDQYREQWALLQNAITP